MYEQILREQKESGLTKSAIVKSILHQYFGRKNRSRMLIIDEFEDVRSVDREVREKSGNNRTDNPR